MLGMQSRGIVITKSIYFHVYHSMQLCLPSLCLHSLRWSFLLLMISWYWLSKSRSAFDLCIHPKSSTFLLRKTSSYGIWILDRVRLSTNMCFVGFDWHCFVTYKSKRKIFPVWEAYSCLEIYYNKGGGYFFPVCLQVVSLEVLVIRFECSLMCFPSHVVKENLLHLFTLIWVCSGKLVETAESSRKWNANKQILAELCYC